MQRLISDLSDRVTNLIFMVFDLPSTTVSAGSLLIRDLLVLLLNYVPTSLGSDESGSHVLAASGFPSHTNYLI